MHRRRSDLVATLLVAACAFTAPVAADADQAERIASSAASRSERLTLFSISKYLDATRDPAVLPLLENVMRIQGFSLREEDPPRGVVARSISFAPVLSYDGNINGGNVNDRFTVGPGIEFVGDPDDSAKAGVVIGAYVAPRVRAVLGRGRYIDARLGLYGVYAPEYQLTKTSIGGEVCFANHVEDWRFVDFCLSGRQLDVDLGRSRDISATAAHTTLFQAGPADHELTLDARYTWFDNYEQPAFGVALRSSFGAFGATYAGFEIGSAVEGNLALENTATLGLTRDVLGRQVDISLRRAQYDGSQFFGDPRSDVTWIASLGVEVLDRFTAVARYTDNNSTIDFYDYASFGFGLEYSGLEIR